MGNHTAQQELPNHQTQILRLSRMKNELAAMLCELSSYRCEPCTPEMYRQYVKIEDRGRRLKQTINDATELLTKAINLPEEIADEVFGVTKKYQTFQKSLSLYKSKAIEHH